MGNLLRRITFLGIILLTASQNTISQTFTEQTTIDSTGFYSGSVAWGDYDNDGDLDILLTGYSNSGPVSKIYRNDGGVFTDISAGLPGVYNSSVAWGDYDNDGDLDILLTGYSWDLGYISKIYRNDGGVFTDINAGLTAVYYGSVAWGDYDNDGDLDILITGYDNSGQPISKIYRNDNGIFTDIQAGLPGVGQSSVAWGDYDNDGDLDILLTGRDATGQRISVIFRNDKGIFTNINAGMPGVYLSSVSWGDYDNDGDLDILLTGLSTSGYISKIFRNNDGVFTDIAAGLIGIYSGSVSWGDYDNDGNLDILLTGNSASGPVTTIYRNDGSNFSDINAGLPAVYSSSVAWGDYNNDGKLDILLTGRNSLNENISRVYTNNSPISNTIPSSPANLQATVAGTGVTLIWDKSTDQQTDQDGLSYNIYVGSSSGAVNKSSPMAEVPGGYRRIAKKGDIQNNSWIIKNLTAGTYYWSVQAIDNSFAGSAFSTQRSFTVAFSNSISPTADQTLKINQSGATLTVSESSTPDSRQWKYSNTNGGPYDQSFPTGTGTSISPVFSATGVYYIVCESTKGGITYTSNQVKIIVSDFTEQTGISLPGLQRVSVSWGDYDNDGDMDLVLTGYSSSLGYVTSIFRNDGGVFTDINALLPGVSDGSVAWGDFDNDGDLDLLISGNTPLDGYITRIYINNGGIFTDINAGLPGVTNGAVAWGDYNNDGYLDILITGQLPTGGYISNIYRNNGVSSIQPFTDITAGLPGVRSGSVSWGDYDNDGDLDILLTGQSSIGVISKVYRNDNGTFTDINAGLTGISDGSASWGDYDNDGYLDVLLTGRGFSKIYRNSNGSFLDINAGLPGLSNAYSSWGDYDNDGQLDILLCGSSATGRISKIYKNNNGIFGEIVTNIPGVDFGSVTWADYDNDGDLDILIAGTASEGNISKIYGNNILTLNVIPVSPTNLQADVGANKVTLSWDKSTDTTTPQNGLTYNLYIGTASGSVDKKSPMASIPGGYRKINEKGIQTNQWEIKNLPAGNYFWSVQAIDNSFAGSVFATETSFTVEYSNSISPIEEQTLIVNQAGDTLETLESSPADSRQWKYSEVKGGPYSNVIAGATGISYIPSFPNWGTYFVVCESVKDGISYISNEVKINVPLFNNINAGLYGSQSSIAAWGDYNNDGYLDIYIPSEGAYRNDWGFSFNSVWLNLPYAGNSSFAWGDYDNDGDLDVLVTGSNFSRVYRNDDGVFTDIGAGLTGVSYGSVAWGDYDNDGDLDILLTGRTSAGVYISKIYRNDNGIFTDINAELVGVWRGSVAWGDYDGDGDLDILLTGASLTGYVSVIYRNDGGLFTDINASLPGIYLSSVAWGDYDNDGDLDILLTGQSSTDPISKIYRNDNGVFAEISTGLTGVRYGSVAWGDYDNDGDLDILLSGWSNEGVITKIYRNDNSVFTDIEAGLPGVYFSSVAWGDYDNDGDLDILLTGRGDAGTISVIYRNNITTSNTVPNIPTGLQSVVGSNKVNLSWTRPTDTETPQIALSYNIYIGTTPGLNNIKSPMAFLANGNRKIVQTGDIRKNNWQVKNLEAGTYYWSVQAIDNSYAGSSFATEGSFVVPFSNSVGPETEQVLALNENGVELTVSESQIPASRQWKYSLVRGGPYNQDIEGAVNSTYTPNFLIFGTYYVVCVSNYNSVAYTSNEIIINVPVFSEQTGFMLPELFYSSVAWGDYDGDGDLDLIVTGRSSSAVYNSRIYRNDDSVFTNINAGIAEVLYSSVAWGDYDNDGDLDILLTGQSSTGVISKVYRNDDGVFTDINAGLPGITYGSVAWGDFDNDGDLDILISGSNFTKIYRNDEGVFTDLNADLPALLYTSVAWGDFDNDGDLDILLTGLSGSEPIAKIFRNDNGSFIDINAGLTGVNWGSVAWGDYDNDGDLDVLIAGDAGSGIYIAKIYRNDNGIFTDINAPLDGFARSTVSWGDYDNDGDLDILITGMNSSGSFTSKIYRNDNGVFNKINAGLTGVYAGSVAWGDYDNDGDLDILLTGMGYNGMTSKIYKNNITVANSIPSAPENLQYIIGANKVSLNWNKSTDSTTPQDGLSYNIYIGTSTELADKKSPMAILPGGYRKIVQKGLQLNSYTINYLPAGTYYWSVQAIDNTYAGSPFAMEVSFTIDYSTSISPVANQFLGINEEGTALSVVESSPADNRQWKFSTVSGGPYDQIIDGATGTTYIPVFPNWGSYFVVCVSTKSGIEYTSNEVKVDLPIFLEQTDINLVGSGVWSTLAWGDYDGDGDLDLFVAGRSSSGEFSKIYRNDNGVFTDINANIPGIMQCSAAWGDFDNDGDLDLLLSGGPTSSNFTKIYQNNDGVFTEINAGLPGASVGSVAWGDYDNDGDLDILLTGFSTSGPFSKIYRNDGGIFSDINAGLPGLYWSSGAWGDFDNDGDLDLIVSGITASGERISKIYRNDNGTFTDLNAGLTGLVYSSIAWGDYDNDGDLDILLTGQIEAGQYAAIVYRNDDGIFTDINAGLQGVYYGKAAWGDYDNDGNLDILLSGISTSGFISKVYRNTSGTFTDISAGLPGLQGGSAAWGDYDNDGDLDLILSGYTGSDYVTKVFKNTSIIANTPPEPPSNLQVTALSPERISMSWDKATDQETTQNTLTYNIRLGTSPGGGNIVSAMASSNNGYRQIPAWGNTAFVTNNYVINDLNPGTYYWSVQTIDQAFAGSNWAMESSFTLLAAPVASPASNILQTSFTANWSSSSGATGYRLDIATDESFTIFVDGYENFDAGNVTSINVTGLTANTTYQYRVRAYESGGTSLIYSNTITTTTLIETPVAPTANPASNITQTGFQANWSSSAEAAGYRIDIALDDNFTQILSLYDNHDVGNVTSVIITDLTLNTQYFYRVRAYNAGGISDYSNTISVTTLPDIPASPVANPATDLTQNSFRANWTASLTATGYRIDVATNISFTTILSAYNNTDVGNITSLVVTGLSANTQYYYRVRAYNLTGLSDYSNTIDVQTLTQPPAIPTGLNASSCNDLVTLTWNPNTEPDFLRYRIYGGTTADPVTKIDSTTNSTLVISDLIHGQTYFFRISAVNNSGAESTLSQSVSVKVKTGVIPEIKAKWNNVLIAYNLGDSLVNFQWYKGSNAISNATNQYYVTNKEPGSYHVSATDINGCVNISNVITISDTKSINIFPNPAKDILSISLDSENLGEVIVSIYNTSGVKVLDFMTEKTDYEIFTEIPITNLRNGIYVIKVTINKEEIYYSKIVIIN